VSLEEPQTAGIYSPTAPAGVTFTDSFVNNGTGSASGLLNSGTTYSDDIAPDVVVKAAFDPGFGHYEVYSLTRFMHNRGYGTLNSSGGLQNHTSTAQNFGVSFVLPVIPKMLEVQGSGLIGRGNGRYGSGQLDDAVGNPYNGSLSPLHEGQALLGLVSHPTKRLDLYVYGGIEDQKAQYGDGGAAVAAGKAALNSGCDKNPSTTTTPTTNLSCSGFVGSERMVAFGGWYKAYKGSLGSAQIGLQGTYLADLTLPDGNGVVGHTKDPMGFVSIRFYPFQ
jgi:hypothetical protein